MGKATEKDWPKRPSDRQLQEARKKDSDGAITPAAEAVCVPARFSRPVSPQAAAPPSCSTLSEAELPQAKTVLHLYAQGHFGSV